MGGANEQAWVYTTQDEITFLRVLEKQGKRSTLKHYRLALRYRHWTGRGMVVEREKVERELDRILGRLRLTEEEREGRIEDVIGGVAAAWLAGGQLSAVARKRVLAGQR